MTDSQLIRQAHTTTEVDNPVTSSPTVTTGVPASLLSEGPGPGPLLIELDGKAWTDGLDRTKAWFDTVLTVQTSFRELAEDTQPRLDERHLKEYIGTVIDGARRHERAAEALYPIIGREMPAVRKTLGVLDAKLREGVGAVLGFTGAAAGGWPQLHMLFLASLNAISAFSAAQQLGLALGIREINEVCFPIINEKFLHHRLLQEVTLEGVPQAILYGIAI